ncbi:MAG TPA: CapA family protein, partial [Actinomycetota bacterium]|nr:CapA family protein [Actinomycetota bacterium]
MDRAAVRAVAFVVMAATVWACGSSPGGSPSEPRPGVVRILVGGDVMLGRGVADVAAHDPWSIFSDVQTEVRSADIAIANLESPLTRRPHVAPTPNALEADPSAARQLAAAGFDAVSIANNHAGDAGPGGIADTLGALRGVGVLPLGGGLDAA